MEIHIDNLQKVAGEGSSAVETQKSIENREKQFFLDMIEILSYVDDNSIEIASLGVDLVRFEEPYYKVIELLIIKQYGLKAASIIFWWCSDRKMINSKIYNLIDEDGTSTKVSNINQLYKFLKQLK
jgi:hypothetical protein